MTFYEERPNESFIIQMTVLYLVIVSDMWWRFVIFSHVCFHHFVMFLMMCFIYIYIKCVHFRNKCLMIFVDMWKIQLIWISLSICITDDIHGIQSVVLYWGGDVWGHWFLKWQPKILNCQDSSHILKTYETFVYTLLLFLHLNYI